MTTDASSQQGESPAAAPLLEQIQRLQFEDRAAAERLVKAFIEATFPQLTITALELRPQAVSLNSFNGFLTLTDGHRLFFKTHIEQDNQISEYYNARLLADAGYPVIQPLYSSTSAGQQLLIYEVVAAPSVFDVARQLETSEPDPVLFADLTESQQRADDRLLALYQQSLAPQRAADAAQAPVHQLFYHRLTGGRLDRFYGDGTIINLPHGTFPLAEIRQTRWTINDGVYHETLDEIINRAMMLLNPAQAGPSIIGHGDAHNGNVFFERDDHRLIYFDPAFAGRHAPLLDLTKPLFHNVFAMWMYFPESERDALDIRLAVNGDHWQVTHNYGINPLRQMFLTSKVDRVLIPILRQLQAERSLPENWREMFKAALFCCPFLTLDLKRFPPEIALLGLTMAVTMGAESHGQRSVIDRTLDRVANALTDSASLPTD